MDQLAKFFPYLKPYRGRFIQASVAMAFVALFNGASIYVELAQLAAQQVEEFGGHVIGLVEDPAQLAAI